MLLLLRSAPNPCCSACTFPFAPLRPLLHRACAPITSRSPLPCTPCCVDLACCNPLHLTAAQSRACSAQRPAQETKRKGLSVLCFSACRNQQLYLEDQR
ncbi:hypothetical protein SLEP1_g33038 [Rubroshorea leprosula]|uniref:Secreted protein n=1 Tax=Rubroshorea leprosula TaxID=152421 RepID=A0AAV5KFG4_9ROSI|nr:hypothetical protein SLEP1_g33038 [Rubroshorea leprosula]